MSNRVSLVEPDWLSAPGQTIVTLLEENELSLEQFAVRIDHTVAVAQQIIDGVRPIDIDIASKLALHLGASEKFWMAREHDYRAKVSKPKDVGINSLDDLIDQLPVKDMEKFGWIEKTNKRHQKIEECLSFFGVSTLAQWQGRYAGAFKQATYRRSAAYENSEIATSAWLRQGELATQGDVVGDWSPYVLESHIPNFRRLTWFKDPSLFLPKIKSIFEEAGVRFAVVRSPKGCASSGAVRVLEDGTPLVQLSFRYLSDDQFWFSLFHEIAHLLLHFEQMPFLERVEMPESEYEQEANQYAANVIIPMEYRDELMGLGGSRFPIISFAKRVGVAPGLIVGQLQHEGILRYNQMQHLKRRFKWAN